MQIFYHEPDETLDYLIDWSQWMEAGDAIAVSTWTVPAGITASADAHDITSTWIWLTGGTAGTSYTLTNRVTTTAGRTSDVEVFVRCTPPVASILASYSSLLERVGHHLFGMRSGFSADQTASIEDCIKDGLHDVYTAHTWSFFRPVKTITTVAGTSAYSLPTGYESIETELHYAPGASDFYPPIQQRHDSEIRKRQQDAAATDTGRPLYFSVRTVEFVPTTGSRCQLVLYPAPDAVYVLYAKMKQRATMIDATNQYPIGAETLTQVITEGCLAAAERNYDEGESIHTKRFQELLPLAIQADLLMSSPTTLGPDAPKGENADIASRSVLVGTFTFNNVVM